MLTGIAEAKRGCYPSFIERVLVQRWEAQLQYEN